MFLLTPKDLLNISVTNFSGDLDIQIFDLAGILVASSNKSKINIASFAKGVYLVKVVYGEITNVVKIIKPDFQYSCGDILVYLVNFEL